MNLIHGDTEYFSDPPSRNVIPCINSVSVECTNQTNNLVKQQYYESRDIWRFRVFLFTRQTCTNQYLPASKTVMRCKDRQRSTGRLSWRALCNSNFEMNECVWKLRYEDTGQARIHIYSICPWFVILLFPFVSSVLFFFFFFFSCSFRSYFPRDLPRRSSFRALQYTSQPSRITRDT